MSEPPSTETPRESTTDVHFSVPVMTPEKFARETGLDSRGRKKSDSRDGVVRGLIMNGYLPTVRIGRHVMVDIFSLIKQITEIRMKNTAEKENTKDD